jgi:hypothetical protein
MGNLTSSIQLGLMDKKILHCSFHIPITLLAFHFQGKLVGVWISNDGIGDFNSPGGPQWNLELCCFA